MMGALTMEHARRTGVEKFVGIGTICSYPKFTPVPFREGDLWNGYPEETNAAYGLAKKMLLVQGQAYRQQYGFNCDLPAAGEPVRAARQLRSGSRRTSSRRSIRKCVEAREAGAPEVVCWGTATPTREFLYVEDCAEAIVLATERYDGAEPVNIGAGFEICIRDLAELIAELTGFTGRIDVRSHQARRSAAADASTSTRAQARFGFKATTDFRAGLQRTIDWYREQRSGPRVKRIVLLQPIVLARLRRRPVSC